MWVWMGGIQEHGSITVETEPNERTRTSSIRRDRGAQRRGQVHAAEPHPRQAQPHQGTQILAYIHTHDPAADRDVYIENRSTTSCRFPPPQLPPQYHTPPTYRAISSGTTTCGSPPSRSTTTTSSTSASPRTRTSRPCVRLDAEMYVCTFGDEAPT